MASVCECRVTNFGVLAQLCALFVPGTKSGEQKNTRQAQQPVQNIGND